MYFPIGWPKELNVGPGEKDVIRIACNRDRYLFALLTRHSVSVWYVQPQVPLTYHSRSAQSVERHGVNVLLQWRSDSSMLVVTTSLGYLLFFHLAVDTHKSSVYNMQDPVEPSLRRASAELFLKEDIPPLVFSQACECRVDDGTVSAIVCVRDELMVATSGGQILRYRWDGRLVYDMCIDLRRTPFSVDQQASPAVPIQEKGVHVTALEYSPLIGGFSAVLSDGRAAFITASTLKFEPNSVQGVWVPDVRDASCTAVNHKYRLMVFGRRCGECVVCCLDDATGGLLVIHTLSLSGKESPLSIGPIGCLRWCPDGCAVIACWLSSNTPHTGSGSGSRGRAESGGVGGRGGASGGGGVALWSVFGSLLFSSVSWAAWQAAVPSPLHVEWATDGYTLWMVCTGDASGGGGSGGGGGDGEHKSNGGDGVLVETTITTTAPGTRLLLMSFVKAAQAVNPFMSSCERVCLQGGGVVLVSHDSASWLSSWRPEQLQHSRAGSQQWHSLHVPHSYLAANWPLRYVALDAGAEWLAVAGRCGLALCSLPKRRWALFSNESHERHFVVTGGLVWCHAPSSPSSSASSSACLLLGCYNLVNKRDEIRVYSDTERLSNDTVYTVPVDSQILLLNLYRDIVVTFNADCHISLYHICRDKSVGGTVPHSRAVTVSIIQHVDISALTPHPACVVSVAVSALRVEPADWRHSAAPGSHSGAPCQPPCQPPCQAAAQSLLINVAGRLLLLQRHSDEMTTPVDADHRMFNSSLLTPTVLASMVESVWCPDTSTATSTSVTPLPPPPPAPHSSSSPAPPSLSSSSFDTVSDSPAADWEHQQQLPPPADVLWLSCGTHGMRVWLPLLPALHTGADHSFMAKRIMLPLHCNIYPLSVKYGEAVIFGAESDVADYSSVSDMPPYCVVERTSQVYLHHVLRQLLRRNLGHHAWQLAHRCRRLPYFGHALELLLHEVVEEEATSHEPIPDPLLPRCVDFIAEFPHLYLATVVQCARKTEMALWSYLFASAGAPARLFARCLSEHRLPTAASCLIILQNLESAGKSRYYAAALLQACLEHSHWQLAQQIVRFLRAIDPAELDSAGANVPLSKRLSHVTPPVSPTDDDELSLLYHSVRLRNPSWSGISPQQQRPLLRNDSNSSDRQPASTAAAAAATTASTSSRHHHHHHQQLQQQKGIPPGAGTSEAAAPASAASVAAVAPASTGGWAELYVDTGATCRPLIETTLRRHAARLLSEMRLHALGCFCAHMQFGLVAWLRACRTSAATPASCSPSPSLPPSLLTVHSPVQALLQLHADFDWPYPRELPTADHSGHRADRRSSDPVSSTAAAAEGDRGSVGESQSAGRLSSGVPSGAESPVTGAAGWPAHITSVTAQLRRNTISADGANSVTSDTSGRSDSTLQPHSSPTSSTTTASAAQLATCSTADDIFSGSYDSCVSEQTLAAAAAGCDRGSRQSELQLRYLWHMLHEAECCDWCLLVALVLRDTAALTLCTALARRHSAALSKLTQLAHTLYQWAQQHCVGYSPLLATVHMQLLTDTPHQPLSPALSPSARQSSATLSAALSRSQSLPIKKERHPDGQLLLVTSHDADQSAAADCHQSVLIGDGPQAPSSEQSANCTIM